MTRPFRIMVVEDNEGDAFLITHALETDDYPCDIQVVDDGEDALRLLQQNQEFAGEILPDLIILDINLPKVDGKEVLYSVKSNHDLKHIPVVILTTSSLENDIAYSYENHANCYVVKQGTLAEFISAINGIKKFWTQCVTYPIKN